MTLGNMSKQTREFKWDPMVRATEMLICKTAEGGCGNFDGMVPVPYPDAEGYIVHCKCGRKFVYAFGQGLEPVDES